MIKNYYTLLKLMWGSVLNTIEKDSVSINLFHSPHSMSKYMPASLCVVGQDRGNVAK